MINRPMSDRQYWIYKKLKRIPLDKLKGELRIAVKTALNEAWDKGIEAQADRAHWGPGWD